MLLDQACPPWRANDAAGIRDRYLTGEEVRFAGVVVSEDGGASPGRPSGAHRGPIGSPKGHPGNGGVAGSAKGLRGSRYRAGEGPFTRCVHRAPHRNVRQRGGGVAMRPEAPLPLPPTVSVVVPVKDATRFLETSISSILGALAHCEGELIIVDNGSTDGSYELLQERWSSLDASGAMHQG